MKPVKDPKGVGIDVSARNGMFGAREDAGNGHPAGCRNDIPAIVAVSKRAEKWNTAGVKARIGRPGERRRQPPQALVWLILGGIAASRFFALAASPGEIDEAVFSGAVTNFGSLRPLPRRRRASGLDPAGSGLLPLCVTPSTPSRRPSTVLAAAGFLRAVDLGQPRRRRVGSPHGRCFAAALPVVWISGDARSRMRR